MRCISLKPLTRFDTTRKKLLMENNDSVPQWDSFCSLRLSQGTCYQIVFEAWMFCDSVLSHKVWDPLLCCLAFSDHFLTLLTDFCQNSCKRSLVLQLPDTCCNRGWLSPWCRASGAKSILPCHPSLCLRREREGAAAQGLWLPQCRPEQLVERTPSPFQGVALWGCKWLQV